MKNIYFFIVLSVFTFNLYAVDNEYAGSPVLDGMGASGVVYDAGIESIYYNPAGINEIKKMEASINYEKKYQGIINNDLYSYNAAYGMNLFSMFQAGIGVRRFNSLYYSSTELRLGIGRSFYNLLKKYGGFSIGINFKYNIRKFTFDAEYPDIGNSLNKSFLNFDFGFIYKWQKLKAGVLIEDITKIDISGNNEVDGIKITSGISYYITKFFSIESDYVIDEYNNKINIGIEKWFGNKNFALRGGINNLVLKSNIGLNDINFTFGLSVKINMFRIDYAFLSNSYLGESHNIGLKWQI